MTPSDALLIGLGALSLVNSALIIVLFRQVGLAYLGYRPARSRDGLPEGMSVPSWEATDALGERYSRDSLLGSPAMILFAEPDCAPCQETMKQVAAHRRELPADVRILVVGTGDDEVNLAFLAEHGLDVPILKHWRRELARTFRVLATPFGFGIDAAGVVRWRGFVNGQQQLQELAATVSDGVPARAPADRQVALEIGGEGSTV